MSKNNLHNVTLSKYFAPKTGFILPAYPDPASGAELALYTFPYDWRQDNRLSARQLGDAIARWRKRHSGAEAWIIAHSNGGIVARWYIEKEGGKDRVGRLFLMGSPWDGVPNMMWMLFHGLDTLFRRRFNLFDIPRRSRDLFRTFPSAYQLLPPARSSPPPSPWDYWATPSTPATTTWTPARSSLRSVSASTSPTASRACARRHRRRWGWRRRDA